MYTLSNSNRNRKGIFTAGMFLILVLTAMPYANGVSQDPSSSQSDLSGINVAIFGDVGAMYSSTHALENMFLWMNATVSIVYSFQILNGTLDSYDLIAFPGGSALSYSQGLGTEGLDIVRDFVRNGGSYFGICGGSLFGTNAVLGLFNGSYSSSVNGSGIHLTEMNVNQNSTGPDLTSEPESYQTMYWASAYFYSNDMSNVIPICTYPSNDRPGMIAFTYGEGTAFLSSPHPEYEEGDSRDGITEYDYLNDPDSEWNLLLKVSRWLVDESKPQVVQEGIQFTTYLVLGTVGLLGLISISYLVRLRRS